MGIRMIGCGAMGGAIAHTLAENGKEIALFDRHTERAEALARAFNAHVCHDPLEGISSQDILLLAFKPSDFETATRELAGFNGALVVSILASVSIEQLKKAFPGKAVLRMMPNLAVRYGDGVVALAEDPDLLHMKHMIEENFSPLGLIKWIPEEKFDAITALTGSGPAFVFAMVEAMVEAGIAMGFNAQEGYELVKQMMGGALTTLYESDDHPTELKWRVTSPGGVTIAGLRAFEERGVSSGIIETFLAAYEKSKNPA